MNTNKLPSSQTMPLDEEDLEGLRQGRFWGLHKIFYGILSLWAIVHGVFFALSGHVVKSFLPYGCLFASFILGTIFLITLEMVSQRGGEVTPLLGLVQKVSACLMLLMLFAWGIMLLWVLW